MLAIIIVHFGDVLHTLELVESLRKNEKHFQLIIVENGDSSQNLRSKLDLSKSDVLLRTETNLGFAAAVNLGLVRALEDGYEFIALLNNDTILTQPIFSVLMEELEGMVGAVSPVIMNFPESSKIWFAGGTYNKLTTRAVNRDKITAESSYVTDYLSGCCILAKSEVFKKVGMFDEDFFFTYEDVDWSLRLRNLGYTLQVCPEVRLFHKVGTSSGGSRSNFSVRETFHSQKLMIEKHTRNPARIISQIYLCSLAVLVIFKSIINSDYPKIISVYRGLRM